MSALGRNWCGDNVRELIGEAIRQKIQVEGPAQPPINAVTAEVDLGAGNFTGFATNRDLAPLRAPKILPESIFGHIYGLRDCNRVHTAAGFPPLLISGLEGGNGTLPY